MNAECKKKSVYRTMKELLSHINSPQDLATIRNSIRNSVDESYMEATGVWPILFPYIPEEYLGCGFLSYEEKALLIALQLYACGQQGSNKIENDDKSISFGKSLSLIKKEDSTSLDRRFNTMLTATTFDELTYHLRQLFKLGKNDNKFSVNFPKLAEDLFCYQIGKNKQIILKWAKDYYQKTTKDYSEQEFRLDTNNIDEKKEAV